MIEVGEDYSKDRKNDYSVETEDGYVTSVLHTYICTYLCAYIHYNC